MDDTLVWILIGVVVGLNLYSAVTLIRAELELRKAKKILSER